MNPHLNLRFYDSSYTTDTENKRNDNADGNQSVSKRDHSLSPARRTPLSAIHDNNVNKTTGNTILLTGAVRVPIKDVQIITPSKSSSKSTANSTKSGSASKLNSQLKGGLGFMRHTESSSNHTIISTPTRNSAKRDDKPPTTDAKKKSNGSNGKQSKGSDIGGLGVDSNNTTEMVLQTPTRSNSVGKQRRATTPTVTPTSTPARQQKNYASHTASSESKFGGPTKSPLRTKDAVTKISSANHSDSFAIYQGDANGGSSQSILFSPDRSESSHSLRVTSATKSDSSSRNNNFRAFIGSPHTAEHEIATGYSNDKEKASIHSSSHQVRSASRSHSKSSSVKVATASTTADILSANKAAKIAAMESVKGVLLTSNSTQPNRFSSRPRSNSHKGQLKAPSVDSDHNESTFKKSNVHSNKKTKNDEQRNTDEDGDIKNVLSFVESSRSRSLIGSEHIHTHAHATRTAGSSTDHRFEANKYLGNKKNSFSLCELSSVGDIGEENRSAASTIELSGNSSYFLESNTQYLSFNADSFRSADFYDPANNIKQSAPDDNKSIEVDTLNLSIVESPASVSPSKISLASFWSQSSDSGVYNSTEQTSAGAFSHATVNGNMRAFSRHGAKNHNSNTATVNAMANFHLKESSSQGQGLDARYSDSFSLNGLPNVVEERKVLSDSNIPSLYRNSLSTIRGSGSSLDMEGMDYKGDTGAVDIDQLDSPSVQLMKSSSQTSMNSILNNAMIASGSIISTRSYPGDEDIDTTSQLLNNCMLMSDDFDVKNIINLSDQLFNENTQENGQGSFTESAILNDEGLNEDSIIYLSQDNKNETFDTFIDDLRMSEADCSYGSLTLFENLSNYIDTLVASTGSGDFNSAADGSKRQQQLMESISLPLGFENVSQFNVSLFNESASVIQSSFSAIQVVDQPAFTNCMSPATSDHSDSDGNNLLLSPPTALSRSIEYEPLRVNVLPMQSVNSTAAVSYLDVESNRVARKGPSSIFEEPSEKVSPLLKATPPATKLGVSAIGNHVAAVTHSPASNSSISSYTSSFEELRQHNPSAISDMTRRPSQNGNAFSSIYCTPPRKGLLNIPISSPPPGNQSNWLFATEGDRKSSRFMGDNNATDSNQVSKVAREESNASRASGVCPDPIAKQLLKIDEKEQFLPMGIATANVFVPVQMS